MWNFSGDDSAPKGAQEANVDLVREHFRKKQKKTRAPVWSQSGDILPQKESKGPMWPSGVAIQNMEVWVGRLRHPDPAGKKSAAFRQPSGPKAQLLIPRTAPIPRGPVGALGTLWGSLRLPWILGPI